MMAITFDVLEAPAWPVIAVCERAEMIEAARKATIPARTREQNDSGCYLRVASFRHSAKALKRQLVGRCFSISEFVDLGRARMPPMTVPIARRRTSAR